MALGKLSELEVTATMFPKQNTSSAKKRQKSWKLENVQFLRHHAFEPLGEGRRKPRKERDYLWGEFDGILSKEDIQAVFNPFGKEIQSDEDLPSIAVSYNVVKAPLINIFGEEYRRKTDIRATALNSEIINQKDVEFKTRLTEYLSELQSQVMQGKPLDEKAVQERLAKFDYYLKYDLQSAHEVMANQLIQYFYHDPEIRLRDIFNKGFQKKAVIAESIYRVGAMDGQPRLFSVNSDQFTVLGLGESDLIEDGYAWIEYGYSPLSKIVEEFSKYLTDEDLEYLREKSGSVYREGLAFGTAYVGSGATISRVNSAVFGREVAGLDVQGAYLSEIEQFNSGGTSYVNDAGDLLVTRGSWISYIKVGTLTYFDENDVPQSKFVSEEYKPNESAGETVEWFWVEELWEFVEVGDLVIYARPCPMQLRSLMNPAKVKPLYTGSIMTYGDGKAASILDTIIPLKRDYDLWANKLRMLWTSHMGNIMRLDRSRLDPGMSDLEHYRWIKSAQILWENSFNVADDATTKAGNMQAYNPVISMTMANDIKMAMEMLQAIEFKIKAYMSLPDSRTGNLQGNEGLGLMQQSAMQSSNGTEPLYRAHDRDKAKAIELMIEFVKVLWKDRPEKKQVLLSDMSQFIINYDPELMAEAEIGVVMSSASDMADLMREMTAYGQAYAQNGSISFSDLLDVRLSNSPSEVKRKLQQAEELMQKRQMEASKVAEEEKRKTMEFQEMLAQRTHERELEKIREKAKLDRESKLALQALSSVNQEMADENGNSIEDDVEITIAEMEQATKLKELELKDKWHAEDVKVQMSKNNSKTNK